MNTRFTCNIETTESDLFGAWNIVENEFVFCPAALLEAYGSGNTITMDCYSALTAEMTVLLAMITRDAGPLILPNGEALPRHPDFKVVLEA
ncbi:unnamed protein product [marine sediment metagenome]|uniref:Uncharacterized protein n=1 Tax=marine sediment metagenome TaxID=412755 RepID=X0T2B5_9ZZZZ